MDPSHRDFYEFADFRLDPAEHLLLREGSVVPLAPKAFDILRVLLDNAPRTVSKETLMQAVWPDVVVEEANLTVNISQLRKALGDGDGGASFIETVPRRGYRFSVSVRKGWVDPAPIQADVAPSRLSTWSSGTLRLWLVGLAVLAMVAWAGTRFVARRQMLSPAGGSAIRSIAILPFRPLRPTPDDEYLGIGLSDALITRLGGLTELTVRPTGSVRRYVGSEPDPILAGRELGVDAILEGSLQRVDDRLRTTVRLLKVEGGTPLWAETFDERFTDMFAVEDSISAKVARALVPRLSGEEGRKLQHHGTEDAEAHQLYLKGRYFWNKRNADAVTKSIGLFEDAIGRDANFALAHVGLADAYILLGSPGYSQIPPREAMPKAKAAAERAIAIDQGSAEAHASLAYIRFIYDWDAQGAEEEFERAVERNPNYETARHWYSHFLTAIGRTQESLAHSQRALELSPLDLSLNEHLGWHYLMARDYERAAAQCERALEMDAHFTLAKRVLGQAHMYAGREAESVRVFREALSEAPDSVVLKSLLARGLARSGQRSEALSLVAELQRFAEKRTVSSADIGLAFADAGNGTKAFIWLERAFRERSAALAYIRVDPAFDSLRADPRFTDLERRVGFGSKTAR